MSDSKKASAGFTADEKAAMRERAKEQKAAARRGADDAAGAGRRAREDRRDAAGGSRDRRADPRAHHDHGAGPRAEDLVRPAGLRQGRQGRLLLPGPAKFKTRYSTLGFSDEAQLDDGKMWPTSWAITGLTTADEQQIAKLIKRAAG